MKTVFAKHGIQTSLIADNMLFKVSCLDNLPKNGILMLSHQAHIIPSQMALQSAMFKQSKICLKKLKKQTVMNVLLF